MESNFKRKWNDFFKDRNGIDEIGLVSFAFSITFLVLFHIFPKLYFFIYFYLVFLLYMIFRVLSKNVLQREKENSALLNIFKKKNKVRKQKVIKPKKQKVVKEKKIKDKNYIYKECPYCKNNIKLSKRPKGERIVMCNRCQNELRFKV